MTDPMREDKEEPIRGRAPFDMAGFQAPSTFEEEFFNNLSIEIKNYGYTSYQREETILRHGPYDEVQLILRGKSRVRAGKTLTHLEAPSLHLFSLGRETEITNLPGLRKVHFQCKLTHRSTDLLLGEEPRSFPFDGAVDSWWDRAKASVDGKNLLSGKGLLYELLSTISGPLFRIAQAKEEGLAHYDRFFRYVRSARLTEFSVAEIAGSYGVHPNHFSQDFKKRFGVPAKQFFLGEKTREAKERLTESAESLSAIALGLGYYDAFHFSKAFKRQTGLSPKDFRKRYRAADPS